ncbi:RsmE family RNA methyltransferase [Neolewinella sp.]|uniref:RsmE family RNA methyltransferase n=1 Tax=Neolewinella sp. TaxID=2993543 RepID=UPI003B525981
MQLFYDPDIVIGPYALREVEAQHAARVLRKRVGDTLDLVDGRGGWYQAEINQIDKRSCLLTVVQTRQETARAEHSLTLLVAPTKNIDRFEWVLEKATEIGVDRIQPILTEHSERTRLRNDRLERVLEAAMKQSLRAWLPELGEVLPFAEAVGSVSGDRFLAYLGERGSGLLRDLVRPDTDTVVAVGPEGGFSGGEAELARAVGFVFAGLGPHRLRTETAAVVAVHTVESLSW